MLCALRKDTAAAASAQHLRPGAQHPLAGDEAVDDMAFQPVAHVAVGVEERIAS